jgi:hypothetical protein
MASQQIVTWQENGSIQAIQNNIRYGQARANLSGKGKSVSFLYETVPAANGQDAVNVKMVLQTPKMFCPFGVNMFQPDQPDAQPKYSIPLSFRGDNTKMVAFQQLMRMIDAANVEMAFRKQEEWFNEKGKTREIIEDRYYPIVEQKDMRYEPKFKGKLEHTRDGQYRGMVFDDSRPAQQVGLDYVEKMCHAVALVEFGPLWIADKKFGQTVRVIQIKCYKAKCINKHAIVDDDDDMMCTDDVDEAECME